MQYPLTRCSLSRQPGPLNQPVNRGNFDSHVENGLRLRVVVDPSSHSSNISIIDQSGSLFEKVVPPLPAFDVGTTAPLPRLTVGGMKAMLRVPTPEGLQHFCQVTFASEQAAAAAITQLRLYFVLDGKRSKGDAIATRPDVSRPDGPVRATETATTSTLHTAVPPAFSPIIDPLGSQLGPQSAQRPQHDDGEGRDNGSQSQPFLETRYPESPDKSQITIAQPDTQAGMPYGFESKGTEDLDQTQPAPKKRKLDEADQDGSGSGSSGTYHSSSTTHVDLIDFSDDDPHNPSSSILGQEYPALDPYEGTGWAGMAATTSAAPVHGCNSYITEGVYAMTDDQLRAAVDEIINEAGFQAMTGRLFRIMKERQREADEMNMFEGYEDQNEGDFWM